MTSPEPKCARCPHVSSRHSCMTMGGRQVFPGHLDIVPYSCDDCVCDGFAFVPPKEGSG